MEYPEYKGRIKILQHCININLIERKLYQLESLAQRIAALATSGGIIFTCGNGGSHSLAEHLSAELNWRLDSERPLGIPSICLGSNSSTCSAIVNDTVDMSGRFIHTMIPYCGIDIGKVLICFTTSTTSKSITNLVYQATTAPNMADVTAIFAGQSTSPFLGSPDFVLTVDGPKGIKLPVDIIQEVHTIYMHILCDMIYKELVKAAAKRK